MAHYTLSDLESQQQTISSTDYDLRVTNLARFIYKKIGNKKGSLIDIGAGNGLILRFFRDRGFKVTGMELSKKITEQANRNPRMKKIRVVQGDISQKTGNKSYDYVLASDVIEHIEDDEQALKNLYSFLKPGGLLIISVPAHQSLYGKRDKLWGHHRRYDKNSLSRKLKTLKGEREFMTYWNLVGLFVYFIYEKLLGKPINENVRHSNSPMSKLSRGILDSLLRIEEFAGGSPIGLTLVAAVRKPR